MQRSSSTTEFCAHDLLCKDFETGPHWNSTKVTPDNPHQLNAMANFKTEEPCKVPGAPSPSWRPLLGPTLLFVKPRPSSRQPVILGSSRALTLRPPAPTTDRSSDLGRICPDPAHARCPWSRKRRARHARESLDEGLRIGLKLLAPVFEGGSASQPSVAHPADVMRRRLTLLCSSLIST